MDFRKCMIDPAKIDALRDVVEDEFSARRILEDLRPLAAVTKMLWQSGRSVGFAWLPSGERVAVLADPIDLSRALLTVPKDGRLSSLTFVQTLYLSLQKSILVSPNSTDLAIGLLLRSVDQTADVTYDDSELPRRFSRQFVSQLHDVERLMYHAKVPKTFTDSSGNVYASEVEVRPLEVPETLDRKLWSTSVRLREYARVRGLDPETIDPFEKDYVSGLENLHSGNRPEDYHTMDQVEKSLLVDWIRAFFLPAATDRSCRRSSYGWKHVFEKWSKTGLRCWSASPGFYVTNGQFKGAMIAAGLLPVRCRDLNPFYRVKLRPEDRRDLRLANI